MRDAAILRPWHKIQVWRGSAIARRLTNDAHMRPDAGKKNPRIFHASLLHGHLSCQLGIFYLIGNLWLPQPHKQDKCTEFTC